MTTQAIDWREAPLYEDTLKVLGDQAQIKAELIRIRHKIKIQEARLKKALGRDAAQREIELEPLTELECELEVKEVYADMAVKALTWHKDMFEVYSRKSNRLA